MERLGDAYGDSHWAHRSPRRVLAGGGLFTAGALALVSAIVVGTGRVNGLVGADGTVAAQGIAGVLGGLGMPALLVGLVVVLPASRRDRLGVLAGATLCFAGVWLFTRAYPDRWTGATDALAFPTTLVYFLGGGLALWFVFTAVTDVRVRNKPAGTVQLEVTRNGESRTVRVSRQEYQSYRTALRGDGGQTEQVLRELEDRVEDDGRV